MARKRKAKDNARKRETREQRNAKRRKTYGERSEETKEEQCAAYRTHSVARNEERREQYAANPEPKRQEVREYKEKNRSRVNAAMREKRASDKQAREELQKVLFAGAEAGIDLSEEKLKFIMARLMNGETVKERQDAHRLVFRGMEKDVMKALLLYYLNSGGFRFDMWKRHSKNHDGKEMDTNGLVEEILSEKLSPRQLKDMYERFVDRHNYAPKNYHSCSACGMRSYDAVYEEVELSDERVDKFRYSEVDTIYHNAVYNDPKALVWVYTDRLNRKLVNAWDLKSFYQASSGDLYHLHPELVSVDGDGDARVWLCQDCSADHVDDKTGNAKIPERSIAGGVDFGYFRRLGLAPLNFHEQMVLSLNRLYQAVLKVSVNTSGRVNHNTANKLRTHSVLFAHDAPKVIAQHFETVDITTLENMTKDLAVHLIDGKGRCDFLARRILASSSVFGRWWNLLSYLRVLNVVSPYFADIEIPDVEVMKHRCDEAEKEVMARAEKREDKVSVAMEAQIGSDVAEAVTKFIPDSVEDDFNDEMGADESHDVPIHVTYVQNNPLTGAKKDKVSMSRAYLESIAKVAGLDEPELVQDPVRDSDANNDAVVEYDECSGGSADSDDSIGLLKDGGSTNKKEGHEDDDNSFVRRNVASVCSSQDFDNRNTGDASVEVAFSPVKYVHAGNEKEDNISECSECSGKSDETENEKLAIRNSSVEGRFSPIAASGESDDDKSVAAILEDTRGVEPDLPVCDGIGDVSVEAAFSPIEDVEENDSSDRKQDVESSGMEPMDSVRASNTTEQENSNSTVHKRRQYPIDENAFLRATATLAMGMTQSTRQQECVNEFVVPDILQKTFPGTFMLGRAYRKKGVRLGIRERNHLLHQFTNVPAEDFRLLGYLQDVLSRFDTMNGVVAHVKSSSSAQIEMNALINDSERQAELQKAIENPESDLVKKVMAKYSPHLNFSGKDVDSGMFESWI